ncbi:hypothetical protein GGD66_006901 [Bradyrhizobium sp. CIR48]|nr:hypothetical protein [Bradyrhizobium sp. CIR48]
MPPPGAVTTGPGFKASNHNVDRSPPAYNSLCCRMNPVFCHGVLAEPCETLPTVWFARAGKHRPLSQGGCLVEKTIVHRERHWLEQMKQRGDLMKRVSPSADWPDALTGQYKRPKFLLLRDMPAWSCILRNCAGFSAEELDQLHSFPSIAGRPTCLARSTCRQSPPRAITDDMLDVERPLSRARRMRRTARHQYSGASALDASAPGLSKCYAFRTVVTSTAVPPLLRAGVSCEPIKIPH